MSGDSLSVFLFLLGSAVACVIGALTAPVGWRVRTLWAAAAAFVVASIFWLVSVVWSPWSITLPVGLIRDITNALILPLVAAYTAMMRSRVNSEAQLEAAPNAARGRHAHAAAATLSAWTPDMTLADLAEYLATESVWVRGHGRWNSDDLKSEIRSKLFRGQVTAWGREHPDGNSFQLASNAWNGAELDLKKSYVFLNTVNAPVYGVELARGEVLSAWPARNE